ncbi:DUF1015 domain-containing protein [bacterium]|nr:DUF1015 domain-containing protein [bacterium]
MPTLRPFRALRYNQDVAGTISGLVAPPYDIIYDEWRDRLYQRSPYNIIRLIKNRDEPGDNETTNKYTRANDYIRSWMQKDVLRLDNTPSLYIRSETFDLDGEVKTRYGFIALMKIEEFGTHIHPHERTLSGPKIDRMNLVKATRTNLSQIFSIFKDPDSSIQNMILKRTGETSPDIDFTDEQDIVRKMWIVDDPDFISGIIGAMKGRDIIIADGHHRYETALAYRKLMEGERTREDEPFDYVSMYFSSADDPGMTILPTHRKIQGLASFDEGTFFGMLEDSYAVECIDRVPEANGLLRHMREGSDTTTVFGLYTRDGYRIARLRNPAVPKEPDVEILHNDIIERRLGISREDIAAGRYLHFCKSAEHAIEDVAAGRDQMAILMNALRTEELFRKILNGERMPQKSTYFYPKTLSGLVMYKIDRTSL